MDFVVVRDTLTSVRAKWYKQSKTNKYLSIIALAIPSCIILRELYWFIYRKYHSLPSGPHGLPFLGIVTSLHANTTSRINLSKKYGEIFYTQFFGSPMIVISSSKLIKQIF